MPAVTKLDTHKIICYYIKIMKKLITISLLSLFLATALLNIADAAVRVSGYYRKNGTYVQPHYRSNPDGNPYNNYSYPGNTNPYTGKVAGGNPDTYLKNYYDNDSGNLPSYSYPDTSTSYSNSYTKYITGGSIIGSTLFCDSGYIKNGDSCKKAPENSSSYGGDNFYCNYGYYQNGDRCLKVPENAYAIGSNLYCNSGYISNGTQCEAPTNGQIINSTLFCNDGYIAKNNSCITHTQNCIDTFGPNVYGTKGPSNNSSCGCNDGYEWNITKTACIQKLTSVQLPTNSFIEDQRKTQLQAQIQALLKQIEDLQKLIKLKKKA